MYIDQAIAQRIEAQQAQDEAATVEILQQRFSVASATLLPFLDGYAIRTGTGYPTNRGIGIGFQQAATVSDIERFEAFYSAADLPPEIELCPFADPSFTTLLARRGYTIYRFYNVYTRSLLSGDVNTRQTSDIQIHQIKEEECLLWAKTVAGTAQADDPIAVLAQAACYRPDTLCFLATIQGKVAGGAALSIKNKIGMLSFMGTLADFRRRGVQNALIAERIAVAATHGCDLAICSTNPGNQSQRNVQRQGFSLAYTKVFLRKIQA